MLESNLVDTHPPPAFSYLSNNGPPSSSSSALSTATTGTHLVSTSHQSHSPHPSYPTTSGSSDQPANVPVGRKRGLSSAADEEIFNQASERVASCLASDHLSVSFPDVDTSFADAFDVVRRLLPYHVFQYPANDLKSVIADPSGKGKAKATGQDLLREEIAETKFALECFKRRKALEDRFRRAKFKSAERENPDDQAYVLAQAVLESDRVDNASVSAQLRAARIELDKVQREKRLATASQRSAVYAQTSYPYTPQYRHYTYPYAQYQPNYQQVYSSYPTPTNSQPVTPVAQFQPSAPPIATAQQSELATKPIPVQLPVASLPALHALGIIPVPATSLPPPDQPQPQAILRGTTSNGTMLSLEINLSLLRSTQTSGLALILNSLTNGAVPGGTGSTPSA